MLSQILHLASSRSTGVRRTHLRSRPLAPPRSRNAKPHVGSAASIYLAPAGKSPCSFTDGHPVPLVSGPAVSIPSPNPPALQQQPQQIFKYHCKVSRQLVNALASLNGSGPFCAPARWKHPNVSSSLGFTECNVLGVIYFGRLLNAKTFLDHWRSR